MSREREPAEQGLAAAAREAFGEQGMFARRMPGFVSRVGQVGYAEAVARAVDEGSSLVIEAGTGTGKTLAYLAPAVLKGGTVIVSTAGKPLQDQLFGKDLPALEQVLGRRVNSALLKGRANYVCKHRLEQAEKLESLPTYHSGADLRRIRLFAGRSRTGDRSEVAGVADSDPIWPLVTSTRANCLGARCAFRDECFVVRARNRARSADVVVVNHHLFLSAAALLLRGDGEAGRGDDAGAILPDPAVVVFDEAHKLPDIAAAFFGEAFSVNAVRDLGKDARRLALSRYRSAGPDWDALTDEVERAADDFALALASLGLPENSSRLMHKVEGLEGSAEAFARVGAALAALSEALEGAASANAERGEEDAELELMSAEASGLAGSVEGWRALLADGGKAAARQTDKPVACWIERRRREVVLHRTPVDFSDDFAAVRGLWPDAAWVFTSATVATQGDDFGHFLREMGLGGARTLAVPSPFNYGEQALFYLPAGLESPDHGNRRADIESLVDKAWPVIDMVGGKTFVLCTSYSGMELAGELLRARVKDNGRGYEVLVQREEDRTRLLERFRKSGNAILVATMGFWEGIDIKGEALSVVVIDKLPFPPRDDPVLEMRAEWIRRRGGNPFVDDQLPLAVIALKQGMGRLIRSETDRGVIILGDPRILPSVKPYGAVFMRSLPGYTRTRSLDRVVDFWRNPETWR
ncbi:MAG: ATP-dependent DNA helicase [Duodenibacillus sp.]|nr:ATP-dependent DNA helicase [Duodenibacillus sp.]